MFQQRLDSVVRRYMQILIGYHLLTLVFNMLQSIQTVENYSRLSVWELLAKSIILKMNSYNVYYLYISYKDF